MVSVQAEGCAPIVRAYEAGDEKAAPWEGATTIADGLRVPRAIGDFLMLRALRESGGTAVAVPDSAMIDGMLEIGRYRRDQRGARRRRRAGRDQAAGRRPADPAATMSVVLFNTGGALKYLDVLAPGPEER